LSKKTEKDKDIEEGEEQKQGQGKEQKEVKVKDNNEKKLESLKIQLGQIAEEAEEYKDKYIRALAEMENQRKRLERERIDFQRYANEAFILSILPVMDNFERAIKAAEEVKGAEELTEGIKMIFNQLKEVLEKKGVKPFESLGEKFDPKKHEAFLAIESEEHEPSTIVDEIEKGYLLGDKVIRPAKVAVSRIKEDKEDDSNGKERESNRD
jgi:molecular chaperone GrpE